VRIVAHRGASATHQENTIAAFEAARREGADGIELDVRRSRDDVLIVHHDARLADGRVLADTASVELPPWLPTLAETLDAVSDMWLNLEIKNLPDDPDYDADNAIAVAVAGLLTARMFAAESGGDDGRSLANRFADRILVSSFNVDSIRRIREVEPAIPVGMLVWGQSDPNSLIARAAGHEFDAINPHDLLVDPTFVKRAHDAGLTVNVWTVDDPRRIRSLAAMGVDSVITNRPEVARQALAS
jgi:glycerophosphoryl diester phosphodiesterase